ncbi:MAG: DNA mismatch repair ATPase MutL [Granulosicoccus sp.]
MADQIGAAVFSIAGLTILAQTQKALFLIEDASASSVDAIDRLKETGRNFVGSYTLLVAASLEPDPEMKRLCLEDAQEILEQGCVIHNHPWFCDVATNIELRMVIGMRF